MTIFVILATDFIARVISRRPYKRSLGIKGWVRPTTSTTDRETGAPSLPIDSALATGADGTTETARNSGEKAGAATPPHPHNHGHHDNSPMPTATDPETLRKAEYLLIGVAFASLMIYVRGIYRAIELAQGWTGYLITHEVYFIWLDGFPMVLCLWVFAALHPGWLLKGNRGWKASAEA